MKNLWITAVLAIAALPAASRADEKPLSVAEVLKHTPAELAQKLGDASEAGEDRAAQIWATAKRAETDSRLGKTSVQAMQRLDEWRGVINQWQDLKLRARAIASGGGTMWSHLSARNDAHIERFLAKHAAALSAKRKAPTKPYESDYLQQLNRTIDAGVKELGDHMPELKTMAASAKEELKNTYSHLQYLLATLPESELKKAVTDLVKPHDE